jgi:nucleoside phosphorylase
MPIVDFAIVTGLTEEFRVLRQIMPELREISEDGEVWYRARLESSDRKRNYSIVAAYQNDMGPLEAQALTVNLIRRWDPAYIILIGIAGSFQKGVMLGDVIVSQQVFYYDLGKAVPGRIQYRPQGYPCSMVLIRQAEALMLDDESLAAWQESANARAALMAQQYTGTHEESTEKARAELRAHRPSIHFGTVTSGSLVIADKKKQRELLALHGKIIGTEMEGAGVLHAAFYQELPTPALVIKGISDAADSNKDREDAKGYWRELAKANPVHLAKALILRGRVRPQRTDEFSLDPTNGSPAEAREKIRDVSSPGVSYLAFPRLVVPCGPLTEVEIGIEARNEAGSLSIIKIVTEYSDHRGNRKKVETEDSASLHLTEPVAPMPIGVYVLVRGLASSVAFTVASPSNRQQAKWQPHL